MDKPTGIENYLMLDGFKNLTNKHLEDSIINVSNIIPDKNTVTELITDIKQKNWKEYISYDNYVYHKKYDTIEIKKYEIINKHNDDKYNFLYVQCCALLLTEIESIIKSIVNEENLNNNHSKTKIYYKKSIMCKMYIAMLQKQPDTSEIHCIYEILEIWFKDQKTRPFDFVKKIIVDKGYDLYVNETEDSYELTVNINTNRNIKRNRE